MKNYTDFLKYALKPACQKFSKYVKDKRRSLLAKGVGILLLLGFGGMAAFPFAALLPLIRPAAMFPYWLVTEAVRQCATKDVELTGLRLELAETKQHCETKDAALANVHAELEEAMASERAALDKVAAAERKLKQANSAVDTPRTSVIDALFQPTIDSLDSSIRELTSPPSLNLGMTNLADAFSKTGIDGLTPKFSDLIPPTALDSGKVLSDVFTKSIRKRLMGITPIRHNPFLDND